MTYPKLVVAVGSWLHHAAQPRGDGFDAHRAGGPCPRHRSASRVLRRARPRWCRPDHHRRVCAEPRRLAAAVRRADDLHLRRAAASPDHTAGARRRRQDPAAGTACRTLCVSPVFGERIVDQGADQPVPSAQRCARCRRHHRRLRPLRRAGPRGRLRRRGDHGQRGLPAQPVPCPAHQQAHRRLGRTPEKRRRFPVEIVRRTRAAVGDDFIICYRMSMADYVEDGQSWDEIIALATEVEAAGATIINSRLRLARGAGADHRHIGAQQRVRRHQQRGGRTREHSGGGVQPHQHARSGRADSRRRQRCS